MVLTLLCILEMSFPSFMSHNPVKFRYLEYCDVILWMFELGMCGKKKPIAILWSHFGGIRVLFQKVSFMRISVRFIYADGQYTGSRRVCFGMKNLKANANSEYLPAAFGLSPESWNDNNVDDLRYQLMLLTLC